MIRLSSVITFVICLTGSVVLAVNDTESLMDEYLKASWREQMNLRGKIFESAESVIPVALARLKKEDFAREKVQRSSDSPDRSSADVLRILVRTEVQRDQMIEVLKPLLTSKSKNERGWANYILSGAVYYDDKLDVMPDLVLREEAEDVRWAILDRLYYSLSNNRDVREKKNTKSDWQSDLTEALGASLESEDDQVLHLVGQCLREIPSERSTEIAVGAIQKNHPGSIHMVDLLRQRVGFGHPASLTQEQQESVVGNLIQMKMNSPERGSDTLTDVIMDIPDKRVLPAFFSILEKHKNSRTVQRQASYSIWIIFTRCLRQETPKEVYDMSDLNKDPMRAGEIWRQWYKTNGDRLIWDDQSRKYRLREGNAEPKDALDKK